jgi:hypothetical protein
MKKVRNTLLFVFFLSCLFLFRPRQDVVFAALDETHYIRLFAKGMDFELGIEDNNTFTGTYTILRDTVYLSYRAQPILAADNSGNGRRDFRKILPRKLYIDASSSSIKASDGKAFSAKIYLDMRQKQHDAPAYSIRILESQHAPKTSIGSEIQKSL